ncbi:MAG: hypothetical protein K6E13_12080 [Lachnospiraceae bacterium]|nr:hypothetical protein [Lachnospiraceae bacterium]
MKRRFYHNAVCLMLIILQNSYADHYQVLRQKEKESVTDQLTGVYNRKILSGILEKRQQ